MTYERALFGSAGREKFSFSTLFLERKIMSTKTTIKRISAIAALALAFGGLSTVAANAAAAPLPGAGPDFIVTNALTIGTPVVNAETATQVAGPANFVTLSTAVTPPAPAVGTLTGIYFTITGGTTTTGTTSGTVAAAGGSSVNIATPAAGTITVTSYDIVNGAASTTATGSVVITVLASVPGTVYASSTVLGAALGAARTATTDAAFPLVASASSGAPVATFDLNELDANGTVLNSGSYKAIAISTSLGSLSSTGGITASGSYITGTPTAPLVVALNANGQVGSATVAFSVNGVALKSYVVTFSGVASKIVLTVINPVVAKGTTTATVLAGVTANLNAIEVQEFDAAGNVVALNNSTLSLVPADATIATADATVTLDRGVFTLGGITGGTLTSPTVGGYSITGVAAGTTTFTAKDSTGTLVSNAVSVRVSSATPTSVVFTTDAASYPAGGVGSLKTTISDAAGTVPAGTYAVLTAAATSTYALTVGTLPGGSIKVDDTGTTTTAFNAPIADASAVTITGTAAATTITVTPAVFSVTSGGSTAANAAADAAAEATDAANAATDAANAAADSADQATAAAQDAGDKADAALAAVTALSQQVTDLLAKIADLSAANEALATALAAQSAALASQQKTVAAQSKALAAQKALVARLVRKAKA
jgi:trimeric autotransporter adhesin